MAIDRVAAAYHLPVPRDGAVARAPPRTAPSPAAAASTATAGQDAVGVKTADTGDSGTPHLVAVHDPHSSDGEAGGGQGPPAASDGTAGAVSVDAVAVCVDVSTHSGAGGSVGAGAGAGAGSGAGAGTGGGTDDVAHSELDAGLFVQVHACTAVCGLQPPSASLTLGRCCCGGVPASGCRARHDPSTSRRRIHEQRTVHAAPEGRSTWHGVMARTLVI